MGRVFSQELFAKVSFSMRISFRHFPPSFSDLYSSTAQGRIVSAHGAIETAWSVDRS